MGQFLSCIFGQTKTPHQTPYHATDASGPSSCFNDDSMILRRKKDIDDAMILRRKKNIDAMILRRKKDIDDAMILRRKKNIVWVKHYNNQQRILLVGEGDFSFSASLAVAFASSASNITATSLDSYQFLGLHYRNAIANIYKLTDRGATVIHQLDATTMSNHFSFLKFAKFDRIIYNFPFYGFNRNETHQSNLRKHRELVRKFLCNAKRMLNEDGEIHITHKTNWPHFNWNIKELASSQGLCLVREVNFSLSDYPGYETKYGFGGDKNFNCYPSKTYMWRIGLDHHLY